MVILENIDIDIDIDKAILQNIDIDKISNRFKFGISNRAKFSSMALEPLESVRLLFRSKYQCSKSQPEQEPVAMDQICN